MAVRYRLQERFPLVTDLTADEVDMLVRQYHFVCLIRVCLLKRWVRKIRKSRLGSGINISISDSPHPSGVPVTDDIDTSEVHLQDIERGTDEVIVSYSARSAAYAKHGWSKLALTISHPWVSGGMSDPGGDASNVSSNVVFVTGRHLQSTCQLTILGDMKPHPELKEAVDRALALQDPKQRTSKLGEVFSRFGHVYVASVEMGGMQHTTTVREYNAQVGLLQPVTASVLLTNGRLRYF